MKTIGICSNDRDIREQIQKICRRCFNPCKIKCQVLEGSSTKNFFNTKTYMDIILWGIWTEVEGEAEYIICVLEKGSDRNQRIYISQVCENLEEFEQYLTNMNKQWEEKILDFTDTSLRCYVSSKNIKYIICEQVYSRVYCKMGEVLLRGALWKWEKELKDYGFFRINRSCIINLAWITSVSGKIIYIMEDKFQISRQRYPVFLEKFKGYL